MPTVVLFLFAVVGGGLVIGATNMPGAWYQGLVKPPFTPPNWLFAPAWTLLYALIALAGARAFQRRVSTPALFRLWLGQMALNFAWSPAVFTLHSLTLGLVVILALLTAIGAFIHLAWKTDRTAALLFLPYAGWVALATYLNAGLVALN
ncbi:TSPO-like protein [Polymorphum gilvum SL003B-26A1]|uniref:TSPO-like protein n=2 Tax=Polymorphum TaxID=991903 RepID=F2J0C9_POLGS|nr:TSPO-like protein [Polymorphum gilvum SL003B-26A1]